MRYFYLTLLLSLLGFVAHAQESTTEIRIDYRLGSQTLEPEYADNAARLERIVSYLQEIKQDTTLNIVSISFCGAASPEGSYELNKRLAQGRLAALEAFVRSHVEVPEALVQRKEDYIPWNELAQLVQASDMAYKDEIISILNEDSQLVQYRTGKRQVDARVSKLKALHGGTVWRTLNRQFFSKMRNAYAVFVTVQRKPAPVVEPAPEPEPEPEPVIEPTPIVEPEPAPEPEPEPAPVVDTRKPFYMSVSTNMLYDLLAVPNVGVEFYLGKNWSVAGHWMYAWWKSDKKHRYWRTYGGDLAVRKWFGKKAEEKPLTGHHLGLYGQIITYDFETGGRGYLGDKWSYAGGIEYGYSLPIATRLNLDFTMGVGYLGGEYKEYIPIDTHYVWQATKNRHWFGPTKLEVSLVWLLGYGNKNVKKGGNQ